MVPPNDASAPQMKKFPRGGKILGWCCYLVLGWCCHFGLADPGTKKACGATSDPMGKVCTSAQPHKNVSKEGWWGTNGGDRNNAPVDAFKPFCRPGIERPKSRRNSFSGFKYSGSHSSNSSSSWCGTIKMHTHGPFGSV